MENKKLLKFLYKDIAEIEELFQEKGSEGFDEYEIEFIGSRFKGAKQVLQILSEKENKQPLNISSSQAGEQSIQSQSQVAVSEKSSEQLQSQLADKEKGSEQSVLIAEAKESLSSLSEFEEELKQDDQTPSELEDEEPISEESELVQGESQSQSQPELLADGDVEDVVEDPAPSVETPGANVELADETKVDEANHRLGDSFSKEKSVNELLSGAATKLEHKISNSPVESIKAAIGINDRYQYIRELFDGNADVFSKAVSEIDDLKSIKEAVTYLQQNYKWKKNDTSLKFVSLIKRRFPNE